MGVSAAKGSVFLVQALGRLAQMAHPPRPPALLPWRRLLELGLLTRPSALAPHCRGPPLRGVASFALSDKPAAVIAVLTCSLGHDVMLHAGGCVPRLQSKGPDNKSGLFFGLIEV